MADYNTLNAHERDSLLSFDPTEHTYTRGGRSLKSVTTLVSECFEKFDVDYWAPRIALKNGITETKLRAQWEEKAENARLQGTIMHDKIERYYLGEKHPTLHDETYSLFLQFTEKYSLNPYRTEWAIFDEALGIAGTLDFLDYTDGKYTIYDWKRSDKIIKDNRPLTTNRYNKTAYPPIDHIPDTTYWHYALQVSIYHYILERNYGINVHAGRLAIFHPSYPTYYVIEVPYLKKEIQHLFSII
ncbi:hypothetical protein ED352_08300 [Muribaculaceae bacterium Isolate-002 (NCI)]|nr:hypothetical protein ED352_08300 [Muribaculaceae bacterium Isolate-002 (NCI)]